MLISSRFITRILNYIPFSPFLNVYHVSLQPTKQPSLHSPIMTIQGTFSKEKVEG